MNKKIRGTIFSCLLLIMAFTIGGCQKEHTLETNWSYDAEGHFHKCTVCAEKHDYIAHISTGDWHAEGEKHFNNCSICGMKLNEANHSLQDEWESNGASHYRECTICGEIIGSENHIVGENWIIDDDVHYRHCSTCDVKVGVGDHIYSPNFIGNENYHAYQCEVCGKEANIQSHNVSQEVMFDKDGHFHQCTICNQKMDFTAHTFDGASCECGFNKNIVLEYKSDEGVLTIYENGYATLSASFYFSIESEWVLEAECNYDFTNKSIEVSKGKIFLRNYGEIITEEVELNETHLMKTNVEAFFDENIFFFGVDYQSFLLINTDVKEIDLSVYQDSLLTSFYGTVALLSTDDVDEAIAAGQIDCGWWDATLIVEKDKVRYDYLNAIFESYDVTSITELNDQPLDLTNKTYRKVKVKLTGDEREYIMILDLVVDYHVDIMSNRKVVPLNAPVEEMLKTLDVMLEHVSGDIYMQQSLYDLQEQTGIVAEVENYRSDKEGLYDVDVSWNGFTYNVRYAVLTLDESGNSGKIFYEIVSRDLYSIYDETEVLYVPQGATGHELKELLQKSEFRVRSVSAENYSWKITYTERNFDHSRVTLILDTSTTGVKQMLITYDGYSYFETVYVYGPEDKIIEYIEINEDIEVLVEYVLPTGAFYGNHYNAHPVYGTKATIHYTDGSTEEITLTEEMFDDEDVYFNEEDGRMYVQYDFEYYGDRGPISFSYDSYAISRIVHRSDELSSTCSTEGHIVYYIDPVTNKYYLELNCITEVTLEDLAIPIDSSNHLNIDYEFDSLPTCSATGLLEHYICNDCGRLFSDEKGTIEVTRESLTIPINHDNHLNISFVYEVEPTCSTTGTSYHYMCGDCNKLYTSGLATTETTLEELMIPINPRNHQEIEFIHRVDSTCIATGTAAHYQCVGCCKLYNNEYGTTEVTLESLTIAINGGNHHNVVAVAKIEATCLAPGNIAHYKCEGCNKIYSDEATITEITEVVIPQVDHNITHFPAKEADCGYEGYIEHYECDMCNLWYSDAQGTNVIEKEYTPTIGEHSLILIEASTLSCTEPGHPAYYSCSKCGKNYEDRAGETPLGEVIVPPLGHKWVADEEGIFTCGNCGCAKPDDVVVTTVYFKEGIETIKEGLFSGNVNIETIHIPASVKVIANEAFANCSSLQEVYFAEGSLLEEIGVSAFENAIFNEFPIPANVTTIRSNAFKNTQLLWITLPSSLSTIENEAFIDCAKMIEVVNLTNISIALNSDDGGSVAKYAKNVVTNVANSNKFKTENSFIIYTDDSNNRILWGYVGSLTEITLPDVHRIANYAFFRSDIEKVTMPDTVMEIGKYAFGESVLRYVYLSNAIKVIEEGAFSKCRNLLTADLPTSLEAIETKGFEYCERLLHFQTPSSDLSKIYDALPETLTTIGSNAFHEAGIVSIRLPASLSRTSISSGFGTLYHIRQVYNYTSYSVEFANQNVVYTNPEETNLVFMQGDYVFYHDKDSSDNPVYRLIHYIGLDKEIILPEKYLDSSYVIDNYAFFANKILERINMRNANITEIGGYAFQFTDNLQYIHLPANGSLTTIKSNAFRNTGGLLGIWIPSSVNSAGLYLFFYTKEGVVINYAGPEGVISTNNLVNHSNYTFNCNVADDPYLPIS